jgi:hypothetical protein
MQRTIGGSQTQTSVSSTATIPRTRSTIAALGKQNRIPTPTTQQPDHRPNYPPVGSRRPRRREWRDLEHLLVDSDVGVRLEVGDVVVGARRRRGVRLRRLSQRVPRGYAAKSGAPRPARPRQVAVAVGTAGEHRGRKGKVLGVSVPDDSLGPRQSLGSSLGRISGAQMMWQLKQAQPLTESLRPSTEVVARGQASAFLPQAKTNAERPFVLRI